MSRDTGPLFAHQHPLVGAQRRAHLAAPYASSARRQIAAPGPAGCPCPRSGSQIGPVCAMSAPDIAQQKTVLRYWTSPGHRAQTRKQIPRQHISIPDIA
eukprot:3941326-Rhodomonas_salina.2